jgi:hypothetical protein
MPELDPPTLPKNDVPDAPTVPHSLAPISGTNGTAVDEDGEPESAWSEVWRRRWLVVGGASVAFLSALAFGRLSTSKQPPPPPPTVSGVSLPSTIETAASGAEVPVHSPEPSGGAPNGAGPTPDTATVDVPPTEVPPLRGKPAAGRASRASTPAEGVSRKRFVPTRL